MNEIPVTGLDSGPPNPPSSKPEPLFRVMFEAGLQAVGEPMRMGTSRLRIEISPTQMIRLNEELSSAGVHALMLVLEHGYRPGKRIEIEGWGGPWLRDHGMRKYAAEKAAAELRDKGYIRSEQMPGGNQLGRKLGVVPSGFVEEVEDVPGVPRTDGRPSKRALRDAVNLGDVPASGDPRNGPTAVDEVVDEAVSRPSGNESSRIPGNLDDKTVFPQVTTVSRPSGNELSTAPSSSGSSVEDLFFLPGPGQALTRTDLTRFFAQPALVSAISDHWEIAVALVARGFGPHTTRCSELVRWLGDGDDAQPDTRLAQIVIDLLRTSRLERFEAASAQEAFLRSRGVTFKQTSPDDFIAMFVTTMVSALDSGSPIKSWPGWFGAGLKRPEQFQAKVLTGTLDVFRKLLTDPLANANEGSPLANENEPTTYEAGDPSYVDRLRAAAQGTSWEDETSFATLLRNHHQQARLLLEYERRQRSARNV